MWCTPRSVDTPSATAAASTPEKPALMSASVTDLRPTNVVRQLNLPVTYVLIHRVHAAGIGVLCQLGTTARFRDEVLRWVPGFADDTDPNPEPIPVP